MLSPTRAGCDERVGSARTRALPPNGSLRRCDIRQLIFAFSFPVDRSSLLCRSTPSVKTSRRRHVHDQICWRWEGEDYYFLDGSFLRDRLRGVLVSIILARARNALFTAAWVGNISATSGSSNTRFVLSRKR